MQSLLLTIQNRPYVVAFLLAFLIISLLNRGPLRTLLFLIIGYTVAFLSEFCSIRWGFPYGMYHYIYENMRGELILGGVPVWDSISYVFMAYASWEMACFLPHPASGHPLPYTREGLGVRAAFLMTLLDIVVDPLAIRGDQWFLGKIFYYPDGGIYFGVPLSNFAGWFVVGLMIFIIYNIAERVGAVHEPPLHMPILGPLFYLSIMLFNLVITFFIRQWTLGLIELVILGSIAFWALHNSRPSPPPRDQVSG